MTRLTVYKNPDGSGYLVDLQADINSHFATRVVAPLLPVEAVPFYASALNPVFEIEGARFVIRNPNAKTTCGCGSSFTV